VGLCVALFCSTLNQQRGRYDWAILGSIPRRSLYGLLHRRQYPGLKPNN